MAMRKFLVAVVLLGLVGALGFWGLTIPRVLSATDLPDHRADPSNGRILFFAGGCASCHAAPGAKGEARFVLSGGVALKTPFGTFHPPNISPDPEHGIGNWSDLDFANAMLRGVSPDGRHYYPSFPYPSYQRMALSDVLDLKAFLDTLPAVANDTPDHDLPLPLRFRRGLGLWKLLYLDGEPFQPDPAASAEVNRGAYLVTGPGHCGECHTPRNILGGPETGRALAGVRAPNEKDNVPNITPGGDLGDWSEGDIASTLATGILPDFETFGGAMIEVQENMAELPPEDRAAIAAYLKSLPPLPDAE